MQMSITYDEGAQISIVHEGEKMSIMYEAAQMNVVCMRVRK